MLILDTHVLVYLDQGSIRLGKAALKRIDSELAQGELTVATISFWEIAILIEKGGLHMITELDKWRTELLHAGLVEIPLQGTTAIRARQ